MTHHHLQQNQNNFHQTILASNNSNDQFIMSHHQHHQQQKQQQTQSQTFDCQISSKLMQDNRIEPTSRQSLSYFHQTFPSDSSAMINNNNKRLARVFVDADYPNSQMDVVPHLVHDTFQSIFNNNDDNTNIYTEPTVIDSNTNVIKSNAPPILSLPPNVQMNSQKTSLMDNQIANSNAAIKSNRIQQPENHQVVANNNQPPESLTIVGQDMAITLRQGQLTQTLLNSNPTAGVETNPNDPQHQQILYYYSSHRMEFLPLCDLLFNIISLASYFCDIVFDSVTAYTLYLNKHFTWLFVSLFLIITSAIISQILSYSWYRRDYQHELNNLQKQFEQQTDSRLAARRYSSNHLLIHLDRWKNRSSNVLITIHILFCGVLWRYFKLFAPVNLTTVKREVSELCILRMVHAFCQAGPMLLLQTYLVWRKPSLDLITDLNIISIFLSLFSICWALSSFNKNIRPEKIHKLVLTWFGVIFQFFWRVGTITSRIVALTVYAVLYEQWVFVVIFLHWFSMFLWLLSPHMLQLEMVNQQQDFHSDINKNSKKQRIMGAVSLAWIYVFCFVNMEDTNSRYRMLAFYVIMFLENILLLSISMFFDNRLSIHWYRSLAIFLVLGSFLMGMLFMWIYYRFFHIRNLKNSIFANGPVCNNSANRLDVENCSTIGQDQISIKEKSILNQLLLNQVQTFGNKDIDPKLLPFANNTIPMLNGQCFYNASNKNANETVAKNQYTDESIPGVFNCRLNPALKRKKKKPSTIPPLPILLSQEINETKTKFGFKNTLESISENPGIITKNYHLHPFNKNSLDSWKPGFQSKNLIHQIQRPLTNSSVLMRSYRQSPAETFWQKSSLSARSLSISPSTMLKSENNANSRLPVSNPFSSKVATSTTSANIQPPTRNFTDKLDFVLNQSKHEPNINDANTKKIIRPKPIVQHSINLDSIDENIDIDLEKPSNDKLEASERQVSNYYGNLQNQDTFDEESNQQEGICNYYEYLNSLEKSKDSGSENCYDEFLGKENKSDLFMHRRPPVPGRESGTKSKDDDHSSYMEGKKSLILNCVKSQTKIDQTNATMTNNLKIMKQGRHSIRKKRFHNNKTNKLRIKSNQKYRSRSMDSTTTASSTELSKSDFSSSSGEDGDIESDVNHQLEQKIHNNKYTKQNRIKPSEMEIYESTKQPNLYDRINQDYDKTYAKENGEVSRNFTDSIYGQVGDNNNDGIGQQTSTYPSISSILKENPDGNPHQKDKFHSRPTRQSLFNGAKNKKHNTPL